MLQYEAGTTYVATVVMALSTKDQMLQLLRENLAKAQHWMKHYADLKRTKRKLEVGD